MWVSVTTPYISTTHPHFVE